jgi:hypothetical protein
MVDEVVGATQGPVAVSVHDVGSTWHVVVETSAEEGLPPRASDRFQALGGSIASAPHESGRRYVGVLPPKLA